MIAVVMEAIAAVCLVNPHQPQAYLIDIFSVPILTGFVVMTAALILLRQRWAAPLAVLACVMMVVAIAPQAMPQQAAPDRTQAPLRLVFANLLIRNTTPEKLVPWVQARKPDIVAMVEADPGSRAALFKALQTDLPYKVTRYDMVVLSRYPLSHLRPRPAGFALITVDVATPQGRLNLAVAHLTRPWPFTAPQDQRRQFARLADSLEGSMDENFVMVGDFNTPPLASGMHDFTRATGLHTAPALRGTWPTFLPSLLRVTIDNAMASRDISLQRRKVGGFDGSDHRPICVDIFRARR